MELQHSFQNPTKLYFVLEYISGGDLFLHLNRLGQFKDEMVLFYARQFVCALGEPSLTITFGYTVQGAWYWGEFKCSTTLSQLSPWRGL